MISYEIPFPKTKTLHFISFSSPILISFHMDGIGTIDISSYRVDNLPEHAFNQNASSLPEHPADSILESNSSYSFRESREPLIPPDSSHLSNHSSENQPKKKWICVLITISFLLPFFFIHSKKEHVAIIHSIDELLHLKKNTRKVVIVDSACNETFNEWILSNYPNLEEISIGARSLQNVNKIKLKVRMSFFTNK